MKKYLISTVALLCMLSFMPMQAAPAVTVPDGQATQYDRVKVILHQGEPLVIPIDSESSIHSHRIENDEEEEVFVVDFYGTGDYFYRFLRSEIKNIGFIPSDEQPEGIEEIHEEEDEHAFVLKYENGNLLIASSAIGQLCNILQIDGKVARSFMVSRSGSYSLSDLPSGIYLIKVNRHTLKVMTR